MASPNINMRDPLLYRIRHAHHHRTGDAWCIYPMYDFAHPLSDAHRGDHAFDLHARIRRPPAALRLVHRATAGLPGRPQQIEFARLNLTYTVMSKRKLLQLVTDGHVSGLGRSAHADHLRHAPARLTRRRRSARFADEIGVAKRENMVDVGAARALRARRPEQARAARHGRAAAAEGRHRELSRKARSKSSTPSTTRRTRRRARARCRSRACCTSSSDDFREDPPKKFFRLAPGREVRLRYAYFVTCTGVVKDASGRGRRTALHLRSRHARRRRAGRPQGEGARCTGCRPRTPSTPKCGSTIACSPSRRPAAGDVDFRRATSIRIRSKCSATPRSNRRWPHAAAGAAFQFERLGYFCVDPDTTGAHGRLQSHGHAERHLGEGRAPEDVATQAAARLHRFSIECWHSTA